MKKEYIKPEASVEELRKMLIETNEKLLASNEELSEANEKLKEQEQERNELFANLSHDLKSSVSLIAGSCELLLGSGKTEPGRLDPETVQVVELIQRRAGFMQRIIEDMFLLAKLESGTRQVELRSIDVRSFLEEYYFSLQAGDRFSEREMRLEIPEDFSEQALMDPELIVRVLDNLCMNALKYSEAGAEIVLGANVGVKNFVEICVRDTGKGISAEDLPHIFERSFRADRARTPDEGSSGLGLSIVKSIVDQHGGTITCESEPGQGTTFRFTLRTTTQP